MGRCESLVRDLSSLPGTAGAKALDWFELGLMVPEGEGDASVPYERRLWTWNDAERVERRLTSLSLRREDVFPDAVNPGASGGWMVLPGRFSGWNNIEAGLVKLANMIDAAAGEKGPAQTFLDRPIWDAANGELWWGGQLIRRVRVMGRPSSIQKILDAFQAMGWPSRIEDPITGRAAPASSAASSLLLSTRGLSGFDFTSKRRAKRLPGPGFEIQLKSNSIPLAANRPLRENEPGGGGRAA